MTKGSISSGGLTDLLDSDDQRLDLLSESSTGLVEVEMSAAVPPNVTTSKFSFCVESQATQGTTQVVELWDYVQSKWVTVNTSFVSRPDATTTISAGASRHISPQGILQARLRVKAPGGQALHYKLDYVVWKFAQ